MSIPERFERVRVEMEKRQADCLVVSPSSDLRYLTGFCGISLERPVLLILTMKRAWFIAPEFEKENLSLQLKESAIIVGWKESENPYKKTKKILIEEDIQKILVNNQMPAIMVYHLRNIFSEQNIIPAGGLLSDIRAIKNEEEYEYLKNAQKLSGNALIRLINEGICGKTELETGRILREYLCQEGLECSGIPLVAAGKNGALPHHSADHTIICEGDSVIIDFGGCYQGYYADITRTVAVGNVQNEFKKIYDIVRRANEYAAKHAKPGMSGEELDMIARNIIEQEGYGVYFTHRLGHGIGLDIHEEPYIVKGNNSSLHDGNVFSNEPGIYLPGKFGIRLEDVLFLRKDGAECLTDLPHDILISN